MLAACVRLLLALLVAMAAAGPIKALRSDLRGLGLPAGVKAQLAAAVGSTAPPSR